MIILNKKYYVLFVTILLTAKSSAQQTETALAKVFYKFSYVNDTTKRNEPVNKEMILYVNKNASLFRNVMDEESKILLYLAKGLAKLHLILSKKVPHLLS